MKTLTGKLIFLVPDSCPPDSPTFIYVQQSTKVPKICFLSLTARPFSQRAWSVFAKAYASLATASLATRKGQACHLKRPKKAEFIITLKAATQIGLTIPLGKLALADQIIE
jgi:hypothetical protein